MRTRFVWIFSVTVSLVACSGNVTWTSAGVHHSSGNRASSGDAGPCETQLDGWSPAEPRFCSGGSSAPSRKSAKANSLYGQVIALEPNALGVPCTGVAGVKVCLYPPAPDPASTPCTETDPNGTYVFEGIPNGEQIVTFASADDAYLPALRQVQVGPAPIEVSGPLLVPRTVSERLEACVGASGSPEYGVLNVFTQSAEVTMTLSHARDALPDGGARPGSTKPGKGPFYVEGDADAAHFRGIDPKLTATQNGAGNALWFDLEPDDYLVHFGWSERKDLDLTPFCFPVTQGAWAPGADNALRIAVRTTLLTAAGVICVAPQI